MPTCANCGNKSLFLRLDSFGLCNKCSKTPEKKGNHSEFAQTKVNEGIKSWTQAKTMMEKGYYVILGNPAYAGFSVYLEQSKYYLKGMDLMANRTYICDPVENMVKDQIDNYIEAKESVYAIDHKHGSIMEINDKYNFTTFAQVKEIVHQGYIVQVTDKMGIGTVTLYMDANQQFCVLVKKSGGTESLRPNLTEIEFQQYFDAVTSVEHYKVIKMPQ